MIDHVHRHGASDKVAILHGMLLHMGNALGRLRHGFLGGSAQAREILGMTLIGQGRAVSAKPSERRLPQEEPEQPVIASGTAALATFLARGVEDIGAVWR